MSTTPFKDSDLAEFIAKRILELRPRTQADITSEAGFVNANYLSMLKPANTKLALDRVPALAAAPECDPALLMRLARVGSWFDGSAGLAGEPRHACLSELAVLACRD